MGRVAALPCLLNCLREPIPASQSPTESIQSSDMFNEKNMRELIKSGAYGLVARARYEGNNLKTFLALSPLIFTQNGYLPEDDGIIRRFYELRYNL